MGPDAAQDAAHTAALSPLSSQNTGYAAAMRAAVALLAALAAAVAAWWWRAPAGPPAQLVLTPAELSLYDGKKRPQIYLAILGEIFDVSAGKQHYARGKSYAYFAGVDGTRAFQTGDASDANDSIDGLSDDELQGIAEWHGMYAKHDEYFRVGVVVGRYYDAAGAGVEPEPFPWTRLRAHADDEAERKRHTPECNSRWSQADGSEVWCTVKSGGIERPWAGVPRLYNKALDPAAMGGRAADPVKHDERCVCVPPERAHERSPCLRLYEGCAPEAERCRVARLA